MTLRERFWIRGWTPLGLFNSLAACLTGRVLVRLVSRERTVGWRWQRAEDFPRPTP